MKLKMILTRTKTTVNIKFNRMAFLVGMLLLLTTTLCADERFADERYVLQYDSPAKDNLLNKAEPAKHRKRERQIPEAIRIYPNGIATGQRAFGRDVLWWNRDGTPADQRHNFVDECEKGDERSRPVGNPHRGP